MGSSKKVNDLIQQPDNFIPPKGRTSFTAEFLPHDKNQSIIQATTDNDLRGKSDKEIEKFIKSQGGHIPQGYRARLVEIRHQTHGWTRQKQGQDALTKPTFWYKFIVEPINGYINIDELVKSLSKKNPAKKYIPNNSKEVLTILFADLQLGKIDDEGEGLGVQKTIDKFIDSVDKAIHFWRTNGKPEVHLAFAGDCIEGFATSQNGKLTWRQSLTLTEQLRLFRWVLRYAIDTFVAAGVSKLEVDVVNGNHDSASSKYTGVETRPDDGHATESAIAVNEALRTNPERYGHVTIFVPKKDQDHIVRKVGSSIIAIAHGHQWSRGKSMEWLAGQALNQQSAGASHILLHGHEHEHSIKTKKTRWVICGAPFEVSSNWWKSKTGDESKRGAIAFVHQDGEAKNITLL
jgi:predicted phosphodiesterase